MDDGRPVFFDGQTMGLGRITFMLGEAVLREDFIINILKYGHDKPWQ